MEKYRILKQKYITERWILHIVELDLAHKSLHSSSGGDINIMHIIIILLVRSVHMRV